MIPLIVSCLMLYFVGKRFFDLSFEREEWMLGRTWIKPWMILIIGLLLEIIAIALLLFEYFKDPT